MIYIFCPFRDIASIRMKALLIFILLRVSFVDAQLQINAIPHDEIAIGDFSPLLCNDGLDNVVCESWAQQNYNPNLEVEIPCGKCITFDAEPGSITQLSVGLHVVGKLIFPLNTKATIETPFIFVEGKLEASSNELVNTTNIDSLKFIITSTEDQPFYPHSQNQASCGNNYCDAGKKPILVAGGTMDIQGLPENCPTWTKLHDIVADDSLLIPRFYPTVPTPPPNCARAVIDEKFDGSQIIFKSSLGCMSSIEIEDSNQYYRITERTRPWQGAFINVDTSLRDCMIVNQHYLVKARYRLSHEDQGSFSNCHTSGNDCLALSIHTMNNGTMGWRTLFETPSVAKSTDGNWTDFVAVVEFDETDFDTNSTYQVIYFAGPEAGVIVDIDDVFVSLPWEEQFPAVNNDTCKDLIINGDAEIDDKFVYPFKLLGNLGAYVKVNTEEIDGVENQYFSITGRETGWSSIFQNLLHDCIVANSVYTFKLRVRVHSQEPSIVRIVLKTFSEEADEYDLNYSYEAIVKCPSVSIQTGWIWCESRFLFTEKHEESTDIEFQIIVENNDIADIDYDDLSITLHSPPVNTFVLSKDVFDCWGIGAQIVQTSHTLSHSDYNEVNITDIKIVDDYAHVTIGNPVAKPTTEIDDSRFAVEVALLSRNIAMESNNDDPVNPLHGPHLMIIHTPNVAQNINGVDFRGFGQQGVSARYPVHFHMCGNVNGTVVAKNTVRHSNQRCYVVHGTDAVKLEYNIAFDTFGHCFMLEDGIEEENSFFYNLGLETKIMPDAGLLSIEESDMFPATFWAANPKNYFLGNVAAGGEDTGFWYEFLETVRGSSTRLDPTYDKNPSEIPLGYHRQNVMHSYTGDGFKLYPNGYFPEDRAFFEDVRSYRNAGDGVLLHNSKNLGILGGVFADNRRQIEIDKQADDVTVTNAAVIGFSPLYQIEVEAANRKSHCPAYRPLVGIQLHSFLRYRDSKGYTLTNVTFEHFGEATGCVGSVSIEMDEQVRDGHFDAYSSFNNLTFPEGTTPSERFNMCELEKNELFFNDLVIQDMSGDFNPAGNLPGVIVSNSATMTSFSDNCVDLPGTCALYCAGELACYRSLNIATWNAPDYSNLFLEVTDSTGKSIDFGGYFEVYMEPAIGGEIEDEYENTVYQRRRYYSPIVPYGNYTMQFKKQGVAYWPQFVEIVWEDTPPCTPHIDDNTTNFIIPIVTESECANLIRNPDGELGGYNFWSHTGGGVKVIQDDVRSGFYALSSVSRTGAWHGIGQYLDMRCLTMGRQYEVVVNIRLQDSDGEYVVCNINQVNFNAGDVCPRVTFRIRQLMGNMIGDGVDSKYAYPMANAVGPWEAGGWNTLYGKFTVTETLAAADSVYFFIERARPGLNMIVDDVIIQPTIHGCSMPIYNGDFEVGDTRFWRSIGTTEIAIYPTGYTSEKSLRTTVRKEWWGSMLQDLNKDCLIEGERFNVNAMLLLLDENDNVYDCDPNLVWGENGNMDSVCPVVTLRLATGSQVEDIEIGAMPGPFTKGDWNNIFGEFYVTNSMMNADLVSIYFRKVKAGVNIVVDNLTITKFSSDDNTDNVVNNGDFNTGDVRYFNAHGGGIIDVLQHSDDPNDYMMVNRERTSSEYGVRHAISNGLLVAGALYKITCDLRLLTEDLQSAMYCDPGSLEEDLRCPILSLRSQYIGKTGMMIRPIASAPPEFKTTEWNTFSGYFQFLETEILADSLYLIINKAPANVVMIIDNIKLYPPKLSTQSPSTQPSRSSEPSFSPSKVATSRPTIANFTEN